MKTMVEVRAELEEQNFQNKLASVQEHLGDDPFVVETLDRAIDIVKEAGLTDRNEILDMAVQMTVDYLTGADGVEKLASDEEIEDAFVLGMECADVAFAAGVTVEDMSKIASAEEADAFGRLIGQAYARVCSQES